MTLTVFYCHKIMTDPINTTNPNPTDPTHLTNPKKTL